MLCFFLAQGASAENSKDTAEVPVITADFKSNRLKHTATGRVETIIDAKTVLMSDGKIIRLVGFDYPDVPEAAFDVDGKERLATLMKKGDEFMIWQTLSVKYGRTNRMGHILAHLQNKKTGQWVNGEMVARGAAYAYTDVSNADMAEDLLRLEAQARKDKKGIWKENSGFGITQADAADSAIGRFAIVEGTITRAATASNNLYLNFGADSRKDFTVMISAPLRKQMARDGLDPFSLGGKSIRVRGWVRAWNGPFMELDSAERLEILSPAPSTDLSPPSYGLIAPPEHAKNLTE